MVERFDMHAPRFLTAVLATTALGGLLPAQAATTIDPYQIFALSSGSGDGDVVAYMDAFGGSSNAIFDPVGAIGAGDVFYSSGVYITQGSFVTPLYSDTPTELISQTDDTLVTYFQVNQLGFTLTQTVSEARNESGVQTGSLLTQSYAIRNLTDVPNSFELIRYLDGDLYLNDNTLADGGGVLGSGANIVLYETDATGDESDANTFVGITASGGTVPGAYYAVQNCCGIRQYPLPNTIDGDSDGDGFIDMPYDVTLQLARQFTIPVGMTEIYTTSTLFGNATPPAPGSSPSLPLLPDATEISDDGVPSWSFEITIPDYTEVVWIDPVIAVGYTYEVTGAEFYAVTAPGLGTVPDGDGQYFVSFDGLDPVALAAGGMLTFSDYTSSSITSFTITGIDAALELDPENPLAFQTGISLLGLAGGQAVVTQTPITFDTEAASPVPLPATAPLLAAGLGALALWRRKRRAA
ncbi:MAG: VPLPA-CTERM sorting domain-containing protein [Defluviimonas sp.]|nr:VPLPA-CTERM sorting domain-containing protein [Defluviimonas sp.]